MAFIGGRRTATRGPVIVPEEEVVLAGLRREAPSYRKSEVVLARLRHETPSSCRKSETVRVT